MKKAILFLSLCSPSLNLFGQTFLGFQCGEPFGSMKRRLPNVVFVRQHPGWADEYDQFFEIDGRLAGVYYANFYDWRVSYRHILEKGEHTEPELGKLRRIVDGGDDD